MGETYDPQLKARLTLDDEGRVRGINHVDEFWQSPENAPRQAAVAYLREVAETLGIPRAQLGHAHQKVGYLEPMERGTEYRLFEEKTYFDSTTEGFYQTHLNVPVWASGLTVTMKHNPTRVVSAVNTTLDDLDPELPSEAIIERWRDILRQAGKEKAAEGFGEAPERSESAAFVADMMGGRAFRRATGKAATEARRRAERARILSGRFFIYRYVPEERLPKGPALPPPEVEEAFAGQDIPAAWAEVEPALPLPPADESIRPGGDYLVAEIIFFYPTPEWGDINWRALVELETASVLYLRALAAHVNGQVFIHDPITKSGDASKGSDKSAAVLDPFRDAVALANLDAPVGGNQSLSGLRVTLSEVELPTIGRPPRQQASTSTLGRAPMSSPLSTPTTTSTGSSSW